jgi:hypothetical protein
MKSPVPESNPNYGAHLGHWAIDPRNIPPERNFIPPVLLSTQEIDPLTIKFCIIPTSLPEHVKLDVIDPHSIYLIYIVDQIDQVGIKWDQVALLGYCFS